MNPGPKILIFPGKLPKNFDLFQGISPKSVNFPDKNFPKNFDFLGKNFRMTIFRHSLQNWQFTASSGQIILFLFKSHQHKIWRVATPKPP